MWVMGFPLYTKYIDISMLLIIPLNSKKQQKSALPSSRTPRPLQAASAPSLGHDRPGGAGFQVEKVGVHPKIGGRV